MQISPLNKHSISIFKAQKKYFAKHNEAHKRLPYAYKKACTFFGKKNKMQNFSMF